MRRRLLLTVLLVLVAPAVPAAAQSPNPGGVSIVPSTASTHAQGPLLVFRNLRPGATATDSAVVINSSNETLRVAVYPADGMPAAGGGFGYTERGGSNTMVGAWLRLSVSELRLPPGGRAAVSIDLVVGRDAFDGDNVGAVVVEPLDQPLVGQLPSRTRYAMPVTVDVVGGRPRPAETTSPDQPTPETAALQLRDLRPQERGSRLCPSVVLGNARAGSGSTRVRVEVDGAFSGRQRRTSTVEIPPSASTTRVELGCIDRPLGPGRVEVTLEDDEGEAVEEGVFWAPWPFLLSLLFLLLLIGALLTTFLRGLLRRRRREQRTTADRAAA